MCKNCELLTQNIIQHMLGKGKVPPGCLLAELVTSLARFSMLLGARLWHYALSYISFVWLGSYGHHR